MKKKCFYCLKKPRFEIQEMQSAKDRRKLKNVGEDIHLSKNPLNERILRLQSLDKCKFEAKGDNNGLEETIKHLQKQFEDNMRLFEEELRITKQQAEDEKQRLEQQAEQAEDDKKRLEARLKKRHEDDKKRLEARLKKRHEDDKKRLEARLEDLQAEIEKLHTDSIDSESCKSSVVQSAALTVFHTGRRNQHICASKITEPELRALLCEVSICDELPVIALRREVSSTSLVFW